MKSGIYILRRVPYKFKDLVTCCGESGREITPLVRQTYPKGYFHANIIACRREIIDKTNSLTGDKVRAHIIPQELAVEIDSLADFFIAELLLKEYGDDVGEKV